MMPIAVLPHEEGNLFQVSKPQPQSDVGLLPPPLVVKTVLLHSLTPLVVPHDACTPNFWP